jgi:hypothetical protein
MTFRVGRAVGQAKSLLRPRNDITAWAANNINNLALRPRPASFPENPIGKRMGSNAQFEAGGRLLKTQSWRSMAKQAKKAKPTKPRSKEARGIALDMLPAPPPSQEDCKRARDLLRKRADALILDLAKRYLTSKAAELTTVLDAMDSLAEFERMPRTPVVRTRREPRQGDRGESQDQVILRPTCGLTAALFTSPEHGPW